MFLIVLIGFWLHLKVLHLLAIVLKFTVGKYCFSKRKHLKRAGEWAIVTGATSGIGKAYADESAKDGLNIMLIGRNDQKLSSVASELFNKYKTETRIVVADFTIDNVYDTIETEIEKLPSVACLVNNVGMTHETDSFISSSWSNNKDFIKTIIHCNTLSTATMTRIVMPKMLSQKQPNPANINVTSYAGLKVFPYISIYSATKAFDIQFSRSIAEEVYNKKILIQTVCPLLVATPMAKIDKPTFFIPTAETYVKSALDMLGVESFTYGYIRHDLKAFLYDLLPQPIWIALIHIRVKLMKRKRK
uniref:Uncharacterized protein n=1 Tax=Trichobilharzia regenti TaxID=157069 RepID=A0AA85ILT2_TRIRE|nr:unnamed protein product [Trichobilharzia regenti]